MKKHSTIIAIGSNHDQQANLSAACDRLERVVCGMERSRQMLTQPIGINSDLFLNMIVAGHTSMTLDELVETAKRIERDCGRTCDERQKGIIRIDIDILEFDGVKMHLKDWLRDYIKTLLEDLNLYSSMK